MQDGLLSFMITEKNQEIKWREASEDEYCKSQLQNVGFPLKEILGMNAEFSKNTGLWYNRSVVG